MKPNFAIFSDNLDYALGWMVIHSLWQATLIALISGVLMVILRKKTAKVRYVVANVALLTVVVAAILTFYVYYDAANQPAKVTFIPASALPNTEGVVEMTTQESAIKAQRQNPLSISGFKDYFNQNIPLIVTIWLLGVAIFMLKLLGGMSYIYYLKNRMNFPADEYWSEMLQKLSEKAGLKKGIDIVESAMVRTPMVVGQIKPMILFPMGIINRLTPEEVEAILAHELAHVMRKDFIFNILQSIVEALFYYHPAVWWLSSQIRNERESACDDIAIDLINSKVNYAKALVAIQEMAYFPLTPSLAFAGQRKSQFMMRMQRILNQPNNKSNIMEKLIATCSLLLLMVGLSFGGNNLTDAPPSVSEPQYEEIDLTMYVHLPNNVDSLPVSTEILDGVYKYEDNTQKAELTVKNSYVVALKVNDIDLKDNQFINYKKLIDKVLRSKQPSESNTASTITGLPADERNRDTGSGQNTYNFNGIDDNGNTFNINIDKNGLQTHDINGNINVSRNHNTNSAKKDPYNTLRFKADDGYSYVVFELNGGNIWKCYRNDVFLGDLFMKDNKVTIDGKVPSGAELLKYGLLYYNNSLNPKTGGFQIVTTDKRGEWNTDIRENKNSNTYTYNIDGITFSGSSSPQDIQVMKSSLKNQHKTLYNRTLALKRAGTDILGQLNPTFNEAGRILSKDLATMEDLMDAERKLDWIETFIESKEGRDDAKDELEAQINDLKNDVKSLRKEIKECQCTDNFDFRMDLIAQLDNSISSNLKSNISQTTFNSLETNFLRIKNQWERGECGDFQQNYNRFQGNGTSNSQNLDARVKNIAKKAESLSEAIDDCACKSKDPLWVKWAKARLAAQYSLALNNKNNHGLGTIENEIAFIENQFNRLKTQRGNTDCQGCPPGNGQSNIAYSTSPSGYSYGTGSNYAEAEQARKDAERLSQNRNYNSRNSEVKLHDFFQTLLDEGLISFNKKCTVQYNGKVLSVDGNKVTGSVLNRVSEAFNGKKMVINYEGIIKGSNNNLSIQGNLSTSQGN